MLQSYFLFVLCKLLGSFWLLLQSLRDKQKIFSMFKQHIGVKFLKEIQILPELIL